MLHGVWSSLLALNDAPHIFRFSMHELQALQRGQRTSNSQCHLDDTLRKKKDKQTVQCFITTVKERLTPLCCQYPFTPYILTSACIFSILFSVLFLGCWQGEFVSQSRGSSVGDHFIYSRYLSVLFRGDIVEKLDAGHSRVKGSKYESIWKLYYQSDVKKSFA